MELTDFSQLFAVLSVQLAYQNTDEATVRAYYRVMQHCRLGAVVEAADRLARTSAWFPKTSEWLDAVTEIEREWAPPPAAVEWCEPACGRCEDTGWMRQANPRQANGGEVTRCACRVLGAVLPPRVPITPLTDDQVAANLARLRAMVAGLGAFPTRARTTATRKARTT